MSQTFCKVVRFRFTGDWYSLYVAGQNFVQIIGKFLSNNIGSDCMYGEIQQTLYKLVHSDLQQGAP